VFDGDVAVDAEHNIVGNQLTGALEVGSTELVAPRRGVPERSIRLKMASGYRSDDSIHSSGLGPFPYPRFGDRRYLQLERGLHSRSVDMSRCLTGVSRHSGVTFRIRDCPTPASGTPIEHGS
jgi:hypothetical protein